MSQSYDYKYHHTDYRKVEDDLYKDAVVFGIEYSQGYDPATDKLFGLSVTLGPSYWAAWYAGRKASIALLEEAKDMGLTQEQLERLQAVAAHVAYD